ncbi:hypothetical protein EV363DRAFT_1458439 [Boletus edulis]|nr:hypothetical protein EV363DRAFT_1458439 [Boletus edulis]
MAVHHGHQIKIIRLVALLILVCLAAELVRRVTLPLHTSTSSSPRSSFWSTHPEPAQTYLNPNPPASRHNRIHGRWAAVRASLGLPPVPREVVFSLRSDAALASRLDKRASRFDLGRKRRADETRQLPRLHFADAGKETVASTL